MKRREYFLYGNKNKNNDFIQQLGTITSPLRQRSAILEIIPWTQNAYTLLYQPRHWVASSSSIYALIWTQTAHPCAPLNTLPNFNHWICGSEFEKWNKMTEICLLNIIHRIFKHIEYFGSEFWKVNMNYWIFNYENVCEICWIEIFTA